MFYKYLAIKLIRNQESLTPESLPPYPVQWNTIDYLNKTVTVGPFENRYDRPKDAKRWIIPTGYMVPVEGVGSKNSELYRVQIEFDSNTTYLPNAYNNDIIEFMYYVGAAVGLFSLPEAIVQSGDEIAKNAFKQKIIQKIDASYFVQLGLDMIPYGNPNADSVFSDFSLTASDESFFQRLRSGESIQTLAVEMDLSQPLRHMITTAIYIFLLYQYDNLIDNGVVVKSDPAILNKVCRLIPDVISGECSSSEACQTIDEFFITQTNKSEMENVRVIFDLSQLMNKFGRYKERFFGVRGKVKPYSDREVVDNYVKLYAYSKDQAEQIDLYKAAQLKLLRDETGLDEDIKKLIDRRIDILEASQLRKFDVFIVECMNYLEASKKEMKKTSEFLNGKGLIKESYINMRRSSGAILSVMRLGELEISDVFALLNYFQQNYYYRENEIASVDKIWAVNDAGSSKEMEPSEPPNFIKVRMHRELDRLIDNFPGVQLEILMVTAFKASMEDLLTIICNQNFKMIQTYQNLIDAINNGEISNRDVNLKFCYKSNSDLESIKELLKSQVYWRNLLWNQLIASGNEMIYKSERYYNPGDPKVDKNVSKITREDLGYVGLGSMDCV